METKNIQYFLVACLFAGSLHTAHAVRSKKTTHAKTYVAVKQAQKSASNEKVTIVDPTLSVEENKIINLLEELIDIKKNKKKSFRQYSEEMLAISEKNPDIKKKYKKALGILKEAKDCKQLMKLVKIVKPLATEKNILPEKVEKHFKNKLKELKLLTIKGSQEDLNINKIGSVINKRLKAPGV
jgi:hypothetical protein